MVPELCDKTQVTTLPSQILHGSQQEDGRGCRLDLGRGRGI